MERGTNCTPRGRTPENVFGNSTQHKHSRRAMSRSNSNSEFWDPNKGQRIKDIVRNNSLPALQDNRDYMNIGELRPGSHQATVVQNFGDKDDLVGQDDGIQFNWEGVDSATNDTLDSYSGFSQLRPSQKRRLSQNREEWNLPMGNQTLIKQHSDAAHWQRSDPITHDVYRRAQSENHMAVQRQPSINEGEPVAASSQSHVTEDHIERVPRNPMITQSRPTAAPRRRQPATVHSAVDLQQTSSTQINPFAAPRQPSSSDNHHSRDTNEQIPDSRISRTADDGIEDVSPDVVLAQMSNIHISGQDRENIHISSHVEVEYESLFPFDESTDYYSRLLSPPRPPRAPLS